MRKFEARVSAEFEIEIDPTKITPEVLESFSSMITSVGSLEELAEYLADTYARGVYTNGSFIEGLGDSKEMGIRFIGTNGAGDFGLNRVWVEVDDVTPAEAV
ncbi:hypothetical protein KIKIMORA_02580 [Brevundimonas phage vB_BpoS-Kikimora]|uniref:Uncharacterized protein n=1 Tax=Brevundimonas phage vB_BpoS-Kikimora TaxID=2948601 RepID=A0A9E7MS29_9CAUD|nr:hypothetical protein KIKIMORA_02580 [Brevundimonas phage vB_BpoS-Kikimora]